MKDLVIEQIRNCVSGVTGRCALDIALAIRAQQRDLAVLDDGKRHAGNLPVSHRAGGEGA